MLVSRILGGLFLLLGLYYLPFYLWRHEPFTVVQLAVLVCAAALLLLQDTPVRPKEVWFRGWLPVAWQGWAAIGAGAVVALAVFRAMDADAHSVSDTLNRVAPTYSLLVAVAFRLRGQRAGVA